TNGLVTIRGNGLPVFTCITGSGSFDFNAQGLGTYEMSISASDNDTDWVGDQLSNSASRSVTVSDDDTAAPIINLGGSTGAQNDGQDQNFTWDVSDASGLSNVLVTIRKNGSIIQTFSTANGNFDFNSLGLGTYDITVDAADND